MLQMKKLAVTLECQATFISESGDTYPIIIRNWSPEDRNPTKPSHVVKLGVGLPTSDSHLVLTWELATPKITTEDYPAIQEFVGRHIPFLLQSIGVNRPSHPYGQEVILGHAPNMDPTTAMRIAQEQTKAYQQKFGTSPHHVGMPMGFSHQLNPQAYPEPFTSFDSYAQPTWSEVRHNPSIWEVVDYFTEPTFVLLTLRAPHFPTLLALKIPRANID